MSSLFSLFLTAAAISGQAPVIAPSRPSLMPAPAERVHRTDRIKVSLRGGDRLLWEGTLEKASNGSASFSHHQNDSLACPGPQGQPGQMQRRTRVTLNLGSHHRSAETFSLSAEWARPRVEEPGSARLCTGGEVGVATIGLQTQVELAPGQTVTVNGDAGFVVQLTRM